MTSGLLYEQAASRKAILSMIDRYILFSFVYCDISKYFILEVISHGPLVFLVSIFALLNYTLLWFSFLKGCFVAWKANQGIWSSLSIKYSEEPIFLNTLGYWHFIGQMTPKRALLFAIISRILGEPHPLGWWCPLVLHANALIIWIKTKSSK